VACYDQHLNIVPFQNVLTFSSNCGMILDFGYNGTEYEITMAPTGALAFSGPNTGLVTVTCNSVVGGKCVSWTITPNLTASATNPPTRSPICSCSRATTRRRSRWLASTTGLSGSM
jgi:hypothetical protein